MIETYEFNTLLDVGCGKGFMMQFFKSQYKHLKITGVDITNEVKEYCKKFDFYCCSADCMPFDDNIFDIVIHQVYFLMVSIFIQITILIN